MCEIDDPEFQQVAKLATEVRDPHLAAALTLIVRGRILPKPVIAMILNSCAGMLDAVDKMQQYAAQKRSKRARV